VRLVAFCESPADFRLAAGLVDLVLRQSGATWVVDNLDSPDSIRTWQPDGFGRAYFGIHCLDQYTHALRVRSVRGHFNGQPGGAGASMARKAFLIARALSKNVPDEPVDVVVFIWDADQQGDKRRAGVAAARDAARQWKLFQIACGIPDPEREAWVLAGFEPCDDAERQSLEVLHRDLGFSPVLDAVRLRDPDDGALRNIKRVLRVLAGSDPDREQRCWLEPSLSTLRDRGVESGLAAFLDELSAALLPLLDPGAAETLPQGE
jgi:hypothetical protein